MDFITTDNQTKQLTLDKAELPIAPKDREDVLKALNSLSIVGYHEDDNTTLSWELDLDAKKELMQIFLIRYNCHLKFDYNKLRS